MSKNKEFILISGGAPSSWTLRVWILLKKIGVEFDEKVIALNEPDTPSMILKYSPNGKVPALIHNGNVIWESLAIGEYLNELYPTANLYPHNQLERAFVRSICNEMHAGFSAIRQNMPFTLAIGLPTPENKQMFMEISRIEQILSECRMKFSKSGDFLLGEQFSLADAMFAPIVLRFRSYSYHSTNPDVIDYCNKIYSDQYIKEWFSR